MDKTAYLTIDDCPTKHFREKIDFLLSKSIPAVLFCVGQSMEEYPGEIIYAVKNGFTIGNHSYTHPRFSKIDMAQSLKEITITDGIIEKLYCQAGVKRSAKLFRFPYGDKGNGINSDGDPQKKSRLQGFLHELGYKQPSKFALNNYSMHEEGDRDCYWTFDTAEWAIYDERHMYGIDSPEKVLLRMNSNVFGKNNIILFHDHEETTNIFRCIIEEYLKLGMRFSLPSLDD